MTKEAVYSQRDFTQFSNLRNFCYSDTSIDVAHSTAAGSMQYAMFSRFKKKNEAAVSEFISPSTWGTINKLHFPKFLSLSLDAMGIKNKKCEMIKQPKYEISVFVSHELWSTNPLLNIPGFIKWNVYGIETVDPL